MRVLKSMDLIICSTPYQILTAINMKLSGILSDDCDLLVFNYFKDARSIAESIRHVNIFDDVKVSDTKIFLDKCLNGRYQRYFWNFYYISTCRRFTEKYGYLKEYDRVLYSFIDPSVVIMSKYYSKRNPNVEYVAFEDGLSDYYNSQVVMKPRWARIFNISDSVYKRKNIYMYSPNLAPSPNGKYKILKLPSPSESSELIKILNEVFSFPCEECITQRVIYFDQLPHARVGANDDFNIKVSDILFRICKQDVLVKVHPRRENNIYADKGLLCFPYQSVPFELCCLNMNIEQKIFITNISSACFMPKIIFDEEPTIVFLFDIEHDENKDTAVKSFLERFKNAYRNKDRLFFAKSFDEVEAILVKILEEKNV